MRVSRAQAELLWNYGICYFPYYLAVIRRTHKKSSPNLESFYQ